MPSAQMNRSPVSAATASYAVAVMMWFYLVRVAANRFYICFHMNRFSHILLLVIIMRLYYLL